MKNKKENSKSAAGSAERDELNRKAKLLGIKYIDLKYDFAFKTVFGTPGNEDLLKMLLDSILPEKHIQSVELGPQEQQGDSFESKRVIYDIRCQTEYGPINIEMQFGERDEFSHRMVYYASRAVSKCVQKGIDDYTLPETYVIGIANFILPEVAPNDKIINKYALINREDGRSLMNNTLNFVTVELPKFLKGVDELSNETDIMLYLIKNMGQLKARPEKMKDKNLDKLFEVSMFANMETEAQSRYLDEMMWEIDQSAMRKYALKKGLAEGLAKGEAKGLAKGLAKGRAETIAEIARKMQADGLTLEAISSYTGLSQEEIRALQ